MTNTYNIRISGGMNNVTNALESILEKQDSALNLGYTGLDIKDLNWGILTDGTSVAKGTFSVDAPLRKTDIMIMREEYEVMITTKRVKEAA